MLKKSSRDMEDIKKSQTELTEMKTIMQRNIKYTKWDQENFTHCRGKDK